MASGKRNIIVEVLGNFSNYVKGSQGAGKATGSLESQIKSVGKAIGSAYVAKKLVDFGAETLRLAAIELKGQRMIEQAVRQNTGATTDQVAAVQAWIAKAELQYALTDDLLRPAFTALVRTTKDATEAEDLLTLSLDISRGSGKDLQSVAEALSKAYAGQTTALNRLVPGIVKAGEKSLAFATVKERLNAAFGGAAAAYADTDLGRMERLQIQYGNLKETIGMALIPVMGQLVGVVSGLFEWFNALDPAQQKFLTTTVMIAGAVVVGTSAFNALTQAVIGLGVKAEAAVPWLLALSAAVAVATFAIGLFSDQEDVAGQAAENMTKQVLQSASGINLQEAALLSAADAAKEYGDQLYANAEQEVRDTITQNEKMRKAMLAAGITVEELTASIHDQAAAQRLRTKVAKAAEAQDVDMWYALGHVNESVDDLSRGYAGLYTMLGVWGNQAALSTEQLIDLARGGEASAVVALKASGAWSSLDQSMRDELQTMLEQKAATKANLDMHLEWQASMEAAAAAADGGAGALNRFQRQADDASVALETSRTRMEETASAASDLKSAIDAVFRPYLDMEEASRNLAAESDKLTATIVENGATLDINTEAGRANREEIEARAKSILDYAAALVGSGVSADEAGAKAKDLTDDLSDQLVMLGFTREQADAYIETLGLTPENIDTTVHLAEAASTRRELENLLGQIDDIDEGAKAEIIAEINNGEFEAARSDIAALAKDRNITLHVGIKGSGTITVGGGSIFMKAYALGGYPPGGEPVIVGEDGPEVATFPAGTRIHRASSAARMLSGVGTSSRSQTVIVRVAGSVITERDLSRSVAGAVRDTNRREARDSLSPRVVPV